MPVIDLQRRMVELGRIRLGDKGAKGQPQKLSHFRLTSASRTLLEAASGLYGGDVKEWTGAPDEGYFELYTTTAELDVLLPPVLSMQDGTPTLPYSQWYELWSAAGCQRRCDGVTEVLSGGSCLCETDARACEIKTRISVMLPRLPGIGVWRLESKGWNAATYLPGTLELLRLAAEGNQFIPAVLRIEHKTQTRPGQPTRKFIVPVLDTPETTVGELMGTLSALNAPAPRPPRPALNPGAAPPEEAAFDAERTAGWGEPPAINGDEQLTTILRDLAKQLGSTTATDKAIERNRTGHADEPYKHTAWLEGQIDKARQKLEQAVPDESDFDRMAREAQAAKAGT